MLHLWLLCRSWFKRNSALKVGQFISLVAGYSILLESRLEDKISTLFDCFCCFLSSNIFYFHEYLYLLSKQEQIWYLQWVYYLIDIILLERMHFKWLCSLSCFKDCIVFFILLFFRSKIKKDYSQNFLS